MAAPKGYGTAPAIQPANAPALALPLGSFIAGPLAFVLINLVLFLAGRQLLVYYLLSINLTLTHLAVLGWVTMVMMGALYQLAPVVFQTKLWSERLARGQFWLYLVAVSGLVASFHWFWTPGLAIFGSLVVLAVVLFLTNMAATLWRRHAWPLTGHYLAHSLSYLGMTVLSGLTFALDLHFRWFPIPRHLLAAHIDLGIAGWFTLTLMGVTYQLRPMFALVHGHSLRLGRWVLRIMNAGVALLFLALLLDLPRPAVLSAVAVLSAGVLTYTFDVWRMFRHRRRRIMDLTQWHLVASTLSLLLAAAIGLRVAAGGLAGISEQTRWYFALVYAALGGWISLAIMGQTYKILPFLVWQHRYAARIGREPAPLLRGLCIERRARCAFWLYLAGFAGVIAALLTGWVLLFHLGALLTLLSSLGFAWTLVEVLRPRSPRAPAPLREAENLLLAATPRHSEALKE